MILYTRAFRQEVIFIGSAKEMWKTGLAPRAVPDESDFFEGGVARGQGVWRPLVLVIQDGDLVGYGCRDSSTPAGSQNDSWVGSALLPTQRFRGRIYPAPPDHGSRKFSSLFNVYPIFFLRFSCIWLL